MTGRLGLGRAARIELLGNAVCDAHMHEILMRWHTGADPDNESVVASMSLEALRAINPTNMSTEEPEAALAALSMPQLREWV